MKTSHINYKHLILSLFLFFPVLIYADFHAGVDAYDRGDYRTAFAVWNKAANSGEARSQYQLGRLYEDGLGITQDYIKAYLFYNLSASQGLKEAQLARDALAEKMSKEEQAEARKLAVEWKPGLLEETGTVVISKEDFLKENLLKGAKLGLTEVIDSLIATGVPVNIKDNDGWTPLMHAAEEGHTGVVKALLKAGANIRIMLPDGVDALMMATRRGHAEVVKLLLRKGANPARKNESGTSAMDLAKNGGHSEIIALFKPKTDKAMALVIEAQELLHKLGYAAGPLDGLSGKLTIAAVKKIQGDMGIEQDGIITEELVASLNQQLKQELLKKEKEMLGKEQQELHKKEEGRKRVTEARKQARELELAGEMMDIPAGTFLVKDLIEEGDTDKESVLEIDILLFMMGRNEVSVEQFGRFVMETGYQTEAERETDKGCSALKDGQWDIRADFSWRDPGIEQNKNHPVVCVSWNDAKAFIDWLNHNTGGGYRLPSELEREYTARAGSTTRYSWGHAVGNDNAKCKGCNSDQWDLFDTVPVGSFPANAYGLFDMHGNVSEWIEDCWHDNYQDHPTDGSALTSGVDCNRRVIRDGSWYTPQQFIESAYRTWGDTPSRSFFLGFRLAKDK
jgi:formylglycine-generating enzyme required for sulfatase activity/TPR repeat protein